MDISYTGLPNPKTGEYGSYVNAKVGAFKHGKFAILCFSGQITGVVDISLTEFGLDSSKMISPIFGQGIKLAEAKGANGSILNVNCWGTGKTLQLYTNTSDGDYFTVLIPVLLN